MGQVRGRSQAGNNSPNLLRFQHSKGRHRGNCCSRSVAGSNCKQRLGRGASGHCCSPVCHRAWPLLGVETTEPAALSGCRTQNLSRSPSGVRGLSSFPAQPQGTTCSCWRHTSLVGLWQGDPGSLRFPSPQTSDEAVTDDSGWGKPVWFQKVPQKNTSPQRGGRAIPTSAQTPGYLKLLGGHQGWK